MDFLGSIKKAINKLGKSAQNAARLGRTLMTSAKVNSQLPLTGINLLAAEISSQAYKKPSERKEHVGNYTYVPDFSDAENAIYKGSSTVFIAARGSTTASDWVISDVKIAGGKEATSARTKSYIEKIQKVKSAFPKMKIILTGHSLGGNLAKEGSKQLNLKSITFNQGCGLGCMRDNELCGSSFRPKWCSKIVNHKITGDMLSRLTQMGRTHVYNKKPGTSLSHSMQNFL